MRAHEGSKDSLAQGRRKLIRKQRNDFFLHSSVRAAKKQYYNFWKGALTAAVSECPVVPLP
jgi:hypothetical protein